MPDPLGRVCELCYGSTIDAGFVCHADWPQGLGVEQQRVWQLQRNLPDARLAYLTRFESRIRFAGNAPVAIRFAGGYGLLAPRKQ